MRSPGEIFRRAASRGPQGAAAIKTGILLFCFLLFSAGIVPETASSEIKFAILPRLGPVELFNMFNPLAQYLSREADEKVSIVIPRDFAAFKSAIRSGQVDLGFATPLVYVQLRKELAIEPLAVASEPKGGTRFRGLIIARADSGIRGLQGLRGKKLAFVDRDSAGGYLFQMRLLHKDGLSADDIVMLPFAKKHDNVISSVFHRAADAGGIREDDLEKARNKVDVSQIRIIGYTDYYPNWPVFALPSLAGEKTARIRAALLKLKTNTRPAAATLGTAELTGFEPVSDSDYEQLREAAALAGVL